MDTMGKAKRDYIAGRGSYRALAAKYNIPLRTMADRAKAEKWVELREQGRNKAVMQSVDAIRDWCAGKPCGVERPCEKVYGSGIRIDCESA